MDTDEMIAAVEAQGYTVTKDRDSPDTQLRYMWDQITSVLRMAGDIAERGAVLRLNHPAYFAATADVIATTRAGIVNKIDAILDNAIVVREPREEVSDAAE